MKFKTSIHKIVKNHQQIFHKDLCTHVRTRGVNMCTRVLSRKNARAHVYTSCAPVFARIFTKNHLMILYYLMNISFKFHKDRSFHCGDIRKTILTFKNHKFSMYFAYFHKYVKLQKLRTQQWAKNAVIKFETYIQKIVKNHQMIFHKDPCTDARTRGVSVCARVSSRQNVRMYVYVSCARI